MGGTNEATCPPPHGSSVPRSSKTPVKTASYSPAAMNPIRFHEVTARGEVDFHDDNAKLKCSVDSTAFFSAYSDWRSQMSDEMVLRGKDGSGGHASVTFLPYVDDNGDLQAGMIVAKTRIGQTLVALDKLAHYS